MLTIEQKWHDKDVNNRIARDINAAINIKNKGLELIS
jgi:transposase